MTTATTLEPLFDISEAAAAPSPFLTVPRRVVAAAIAGNALELFGFLTYAFFAV